MARTPDRVTTAAPMTPEQFVFWAQGYITGVGNERIENDPHTALVTLLEGLQGVYIPQLRSGGCGCGGKG